MSTVLYHGEPNGPSLAVLAALAESGLDIECRRIDLAAGERHALVLAEPTSRDMGIEGEGPVLVVDGEAMTESVFLAQYLDEAAGGVGLQPADAYAHWEMLMWCRQITERVAPAAALLGNLAHMQAPLTAMEDSAFGELAASIASEDLRLRWEALRDGEADPAQVADSKTKVAQGVARVEDKLGDGREWLMGAFSIADLETYAWLAGMVSVEPEAFGDKPRTAAWMARVKARPSVQTALARATVSDPQAAWAPGPEINRWG
jgi:glutathione S-transferase